MTLTLKNSRFVLILSLALLVLSHQAPLKSGDGKTTIVGKPDSGITVANVEVEGARTIATAPGEKAPNSAIDTSQTQKLLKLLIDAKSADAENGNQEEVKEAAGSEEEATKEAVKKTNLPSDKPLLTTQQTPSKPQTQQLEKEQSKSTEIVKAKDSNTDKVTAIDSSDVSSQIQKFVSKTAKVASAAFSGQKVVKESKSSMDKPIDLQRLKAAITADEASTSQIDNANKVEDNLLKEVRPNIEAKENSGAQTESKIQIKQQTLSKERKHEKSSSLEQKPQKQQNSQKQEVQKQQPKESSPKQSEKKSEQKPIDPSPPHNQIPVKQIKIEQKKEPMSKPKQMTPEEERVETKKRLELQWIKSRDYEQQKYQKKLLKQKLEEEGQDPEEYLDLKTKSEKSEKKDLNEDGFDFETKDWQQTPESKNVRLGKSDQAKMAKEGSASSHEEPTHQTFERLIQKQIYELGYIENVEASRQSSDKMKMLTQEQNHSSNSLVLWEVLGVFILVGVIIYSIKTRSQISESQNRYGNRQSIPSTESLV